MECYGYEFLIGIVFYKGIYSYLVIYVFLFSMYLSGNLLLIAFYLIILNLKLAYKNEPYILTKYLYSVYINTPKPYRFP